MSASERAAWAAHCARCGPSWGSHGSFVAIAGVILAPRLKASCQTVVVWYEFGMAYLTAEQFDFPLDDPRVESSTFAELREFWDASKRLGGLLTQSQAARILGVGPGSISNLVLNERLSCATVAGVRMVSAVEVMVLHKERLKGIKNAGGRGLKGPSLAELVKLASDDCQGI